MYKRKDLKIPDSILKVVSNARRANFDAKDLLEALIREWGGIEKFAADIVADLKSPSSTALTRSKGYEMINRLIIYTTSNMPAEEPVSEMDNAALLQATSEALDNLVKKGAITTENDSVKLKKIK